MISRIIAKSDIKKWVYTQEKKWTNSIDATKWSIFDIIKSNIKIISTRTKSLLWTMIIWRDIIKAQHSLESEWYTIISRYESQNIILASIKDITYPHSKYFITYNIKNWEIKSFENAMEARKSITIIP